MDIEALNLEKLKGLSTHYPTRVGELAMLVEQRIENGTGEAIFQTFSPESPFLNPENGIPDPLILANQGIILHNRQHD